MPSINDFGFFDRKQEFSITYGDLPHWEQVGATYFITFRTADSLPGSVLQLWQRERDDWLAKQTGNRNKGPWQDKFEQLNDRQRQTFEREFRHKLELKLDECHGRCLLKEPRFAKVVADSLRYFDGQRYALGDFIVMPNHVHVLVCCFKGIRLREQCYGWKHFTAKEINQLCGTKGAFWQTERFDHLVRGLDNFRQFQKYIRENPKEAGLRECEFIHYSIDCP